MAALVLVTGATGHIGNVLVRKLLEQGQKVRALTWRGSDTLPLQSLELEQIAGDVLDPASLECAMQGVESVYHLAGVISILPGRDLNVWRVNVEGTRNVLEAARQTGIRRLIYTSSIHAFARTRPGLTVDESAGYDQSSAYNEYDRSKAAASLAVQEAAGKGLDAVIVCPTGVIGPNDFRGSEMGEVIRKASEGRPMFYVDGAYNFVDVRDVAQGMMAAMEHGRCGESYILGGQSIPVQYILKTVREVSGKNFTSIKIPLPLARLAARFTPWYYRRTKVRPSFTAYALEVLQSNSEISYKKAQTELGYTARPIYESIADSVRWFQHNRQ